MAIAVKALPGRLGGLSGFSALYVLSGKIKVAIDAMHDYGR
jgi:hypothetical protein